jgi:hypothetical protein
MVACSAASGNDSAPAARAASTYAPTVDGAVVNGWFLPSKEELNELDISRVGGLNPYGGYWSSSQYGEVDVWAQYIWFGGGDDARQIGHFKRASSLVKPVRAF